MPRARRDDNGRIPSGTRVGKWTVTAFLGGGGQAGVYEARDPDGNRGALKTLWTLTPKHRDRFRKESVAASQLDHPSIVKVMDAQAEDDEPHLVFELCLGRSLADVPPDALVTLRFQAIRWCEAICDALSCTHGTGLFHRDVKPANILFLGPDRATPKLGDFGIVYMDDDAEDRITRTDEQVGPRFYMAPELRDGRSDRIGPWSDVYSLGKVVYYVCSGGRTPPDRENLRDQRYNLVAVTNDPDLEPVAAVLDRAVVEDPARRIQDCRNLKALLAQARETIEMIKRDRLEGRPVEGEWATYRCVFCFHGRYQMVVNGWDEGGRLYRNSGYARGGGGLNPIPIAMLKCNRCGNVQEFFKSGSWMDNS